MSDSRIRNIILLFFALGTLALNARNLRADVSLEHNLCWEAPEIPCVKINFIDTLGRVNYSDITFKITSDRNEDKDLIKVTRRLNITRPYGETQQFYLNISEPGFYKCFVEDGGKVIKQFNIAYEPKLVYSLPDYKSDFHNFWDEALAELLTVDGEYTVVEDPDKSGTSRKAYAVSMKSIGGETVNGYLYMPVSPGKYPAVIYYNGYGSMPWYLDADSRNDLIEFVFSVRGQMFNTDNRYGDWIQYRLDNPQEYYYRGAFMDAVRAIDFISQLDNVDTEMIFAEGGSQGGALTLAVAALDDRLAGIAPYIPFLSDYPDYFKIVQWPANAIREAQKKYTLSDKQVLENLSYFDIKNFARMINCPILMGIGLQDTVCPPHTNIASYNLIETPKQLVIYPDKGHTVDYKDWSAKRDKFINELITTIQNKRK